MTPPRVPKDRNQPGAGSSKGEPVFLAVGRLRRPHGVKGEMLMEVLTDFPERFKRGMTLFIGDQHTPLRLRSIRASDQLLLVAFQGYDTPEAVGEFRNQVVQVRAEDRPPLAEGEYYHHQLLGLRVVDENGAPLGVLKEILETGANDVFVIQPEHGPEILMPALESVILNVDLQKGEMRVHVMPGILPEDADSGESAGTP